MKIDGVGLPGEPHPSFLLVLFYGDQVLYFLKFPLFDSLHLHDVFRFLVRTAIDDGLGFHRSNSF